MHSHIGAGSDPEHWLQSAQLLLDLIDSKLPDVEVLNLGGGLKVARTYTDIATDIPDVSAKLF